MVHLLSRDNKHELCLFGRLSSNIVRGPFRKRSTLLPKLSSQNTVLRITDWKYRESLARLEKSKTLKLCLKNAFREPLAKILFRFS